MDAYEAQLQAVEQALLTTESAIERSELEALKENLLELLALTKNSGSNDEESTATANDTLDDEMQRFMAEVNNIDNDKKTSEENEVDEAKLGVLRTKYAAMVGDKCSAPHEHSWGAVSYHNAIICGIEDEIEINGDGEFDIRLRVLYTNPTHREMLPCTYFLEGNCRFDTARCHYSHGAVVSATSIKEYNPPNFERLARNCIVLAKLDDRIWHRGRVLCVNFVEHQCRVRLDGKDHKERERDFPFEELFPLLNDEEDYLSDNTSDSNDLETDSEELDDYEAMRQSCLVEQSLFNFNPTTAIGDWEKYTRGIGSKLMAKMGYIHGTGLGSDGRGIITPISAQIFPPGRSLDACMELREAANGDKNFFSVEKKLKRAQKKQEAINEKIYARETNRVDVFSFLNEKVLSGSRKDTGQAKTDQLQAQSTKSLNVESVRLADDIRRKEREIAQFQTSMTRNSRDEVVRKKLQSQLNTKQQELDVLQNQERTINKEKQSRKTKDKMFAF